MSRKYQYDTYIASYLCIVEIEHYQKTIPIEKSEQTAAHNRTQAMVAAGMTVIDGKSARTDREFTSWDIFQS